MGLYMSQMIWLSAAKKVTTIMTVNLQLGDFLPVSSL